jgi:DNA polymerase-3 subunit delta'
MRFKDIIGHEALKRHLAESIDKGRISHAQLFSGAAGVGTLPLAIAYAQYLNCTSRHDGDSCGVCPSCIKMQQLAHPDLHFVFPVNKQGKKSGEVVLSADFMPLWREMIAENGGYFTRQEWYDRLDLGKTLRGMISAREADEIIRRLQYKSFESEYKITIIWQPETMNEEAANKILKILEEPWDKTLFMLITEHPEQLLDTIISRTQPINVGRIEPEALAAYAVERLGATPESAAAAARIADGSIIALRRVLATEGAAQTDNFELFTRLMRLSFSNRHLELFDWAEQLASAGREAQKNFFEYALGLIRESYMLTAGLDNLSHLWGQEREFCLKFAPYVANHNVEALVAEMERALRDLVQNGNPRMVLTHFALATSKLIAMRG